MDIHIRIDPVCVAGLCGIQLTDVTPNDGRTLKSILRDIVMGGKFMKYRVKQVGKYFFPQYKKAFLWRNFESEHKDPFRPSLSDITLPVIFETLQDAMCFIRDFADTKSESVVKYHPVDV
ncbi:hypothetical protein clash_47 [Pseudomonas phage clash]|nr:hypothetical protein clash_47 [Pseudomonas phage clash]QIQ67450.1 hypothetical protein otherone_47 [Pseudomonas phage otherone]